LKGTFHDGMKGEASPIRGRDLKTDGTDADDEAIVQGWLGLTRLGGGNIRNDKLKSNQARKIWNNG